MVVVGVGAVVLHNDSILLVKRSGCPYRGFWSIPGGRVEFGEKLEDAVKRELLEETGVEAEPIGVIYVSEIIPASCIDCYEHIVIIDFLVKPKTTLIKPSSDALDAGFFKLNDPPKPLSPHAKSLINRLSTMLKTGNLCIIDFHGEPRV